jgi:hypothetical protein
LSHLRETQRIEFRNDYANNIPKPIEQGTAAVAGLHRGGNLHYA